MSVDLQTIGGADDGDLTSVFWFPTVVSSGVISVLGLLVLVNLMSL